MLATGFEKKVVDKYSYKTWRTYALVLETIKQLDYMYMGVLDKIVGLPLSPSASICSHELIENLQRLYLVTLFAFCMALDAA